MKKILHVVFINISVLLIFLIIFEVFGQILFHAKTDRWLYRGEDTEFIKFHRALYERHPTLGVVLQKSIDIEYDGTKVTTLDNRTRWTGAPEPESGVIKVAVIGGSTTFGTRITDRDSWPALLQEKLGDRYAVTNFGVPGYDSAQSLIQLMLLVSESRPDIIFFYMGWNDISHYHVEDLGADFFKGGIKQVETTLDIDFYDYKESFIKRFYKTSAIGKFTRILASRLIKAGNKKKLIGRDDADSFVDRVYLRNLKYMKLIAESFDSKPQIVFVPQIVNDEKFLSQDGVSLWSRHINNKSMPVLLERFNALLQQVCSPDENHCHIVNNVLNEHWETGDFVDNGHFNRQGGLKFADIIAAKIRGIFNK